MKKIIRIFNLFMIAFAAFLLVACSTIDSDVLIKGFSYEDNNLIVEFKSGKTEDVGALDSDIDFKVVNNELILINTNTSAERVIGNIGSKFLVKFADVNGTVYQLVLVSKNRAIGEPAKPTKDGYDFINWFLNGEEYKFKNTVKDNITLVAHWDKAHDVPGDLILGSEDNVSLQGDIITLEKQDLLFQYSKVQENSAGHISLEHTGLITNYTAINGIKGIKVYFKAKTTDAKLYLYYGDHALPIYNEQALVSGSYVEFIKIPTHFVIEALDKPFTPADFYEKDHEFQFQLKEPAKAVIEIEKVEIYFTEAEEIEFKILPKMYVDVALDGNGNPLPILNKVDYIDSKIRIVDEENEEYNLGGEEGLTAGIRLRGNSTRTLPKRPYKIKFDKKQSLFGLTSAKDWALLADYMDGSALHNYTALKMGQSLDSFAYSPNPNLIELYLNDVYKGLYLLTEHQEAKEGRVEIDFKITEEMAYEDMNFFIELDRSAMYYPETEIEGENYFTIEVDPDDKYGTYYFSLKYPERKDFEKALGVSEATDLKFEGFFNYVKEYTIDLLDLFNKQKDFENFSNQVDVNSLLDFLMIDYIMLETDHKYQSQKMHYIAEDEKLYFGPIWDYDSMVMGLPFEKIGVDYPSDKANDPKYRLPYKRTSFYNHFFNDFVKNYDGLNRLKARYQDVGSQMISDILLHIEKDVLPHIALDLINDANLWYKGNLSMIFENVKYVDTYLRNRQAFLDDYLK